VDIENNKEAVNGGDRLDNDIKSRIFPGPRKGGRRLKREIRGTERVLPEAAEMRLGTVPDSLELFSILSDRGSVNLLKAAYTGLKTNSSNFVGNLSKRQFYTRLRRLCDLGLIEKRSLESSGGGKSMYRTTSLGSIIYNGHIETMEHALSNYWELKAIDILKTNPNFPPVQKDAIINQLVQSNDSLNRMLNSTYLSSFSVLKDFNRLIIEVMRVLDNAQKNIYFASRYHDPHVSGKLFESFSKGIGVHIIDGTPDQISLEKRINAIVRKAPNQDTSRMIDKMIHAPSNRFELLRVSDLPVSFIVVDELQVVYETVNHTNPQQFTSALAFYDDAYLAQQFINYFKILSEKAQIPRLIQTAESKTLNSTRSRPSVSKNSSNSNGKKY
jgi:DNA-binding HxlR family transcriptional regulator